MQKAMKKLEMAQQMQKQVTIVTMTTELLIISCFILSQHSIADTRFLVTVYINSKDGQLFTSKVSGIIKN